MEISDYIPSYPELDDPEFNDKVFHKKEFYDLRTGIDIPSSGKPGDLWPHQQLMSRFISPYTPYNEQLLFHTPGTGKTCGSAAIVEVNKQDPLIRKPVLIIVPNDTLVNQWKRQIALVCTDGEYIPENYFSKDIAEKLTDAEKTTRLNKLLRPVYHITTMERMRRQIDKFKGPGGDQILRNRYSNTIIIIDEAHNLRIQSNTSKKNIEASRGRYKSFNRFLHLVVNSKIMLLSGTPMFDRIGELPGLMNLILPLDQQLPTGKKFTDRYLKKSEGMRKIKNVKKLFSYLVGRVSYIREGGNFPRRVDLGESDWTKFLKTFGVEMSPTQLNGYLEAYAKDTEKGEKTTGLWKNSRQAAVFVYQNVKQEYLWGTAATGLLTMKSKPKTMIIKNRKVTYTLITLVPKYRNDLRDNLEQYSAKYKEIVDFVLEHKKQPVFIFTPLVSGAGGAIFLGLILGLFGYAKAVGVESSPALRYALITGDDKSSLQRKTLIDIFNSKENANGEIIQVMIATKTISEGTSFTNVQHEIVVSPYWNNSGTEQAIGRGLRADSLIDLPESKRVVTVQQLAITSPNLPENENIDAHMYKMSEVKDFEIKVGERVLKRVAWDCPLNYARNVRAIDKNESRSCDYQKCNYLCYQTTPEKVKPKWVYSIPENDLDESTFLLYYSKPELLKVVEKIQNLLRMYSFIDIQGLNDALDVSSFKLLVIAIEYIIENHVTVYNRWGMACFLRKEGNMLFLSDVPTEKDILGSWYARYPYANQQIPLSQVIDDDLLAKDNPKLDTFDPAGKAAQQIIDGMSLESRIFIFESLLQIEPEKMTKTQSQLFDTFVSLFKTHIFTVEETLVHDLEKTKLALDYVDFTTGDGGSLRCFKDSTWSDCGKKEEEQLTSVIKDIKNVSTEGITNNKYGVYGILTTDGKFQIADKTKEKATVVTKKGAKKTSGSDRRTKYTGRVCSYWKKPQLIELYLRVGAEPSIPIDTTLKSKSALMAEAAKLNIDSIIPKNATIATLQKIVTFGGQKVVDLCDQLQKWFTENNLIIDQK